MPVCIYRTLFTALLGAGLLAKLPLSLAGGLDVGNFKNYSDLHEDKQNLAGSPPRAIMQSQTTPQTPKVRRHAPEKQIPRPAFTSKEDPSVPVHLTPKPTKKGQKISPPKKSYTRSIRKMIRQQNKKGRRFGNIKLYARENHWGSPVKIQSCYGDNILTIFAVTNKGETGDLWFEFKNVTMRNKGKRRHKWITVNPGMLIRGRTIYLRAQSSKGHDVISLKVKGNCIEDPPKIAVPLQ